jgi:hypothetical protein
LFFIIILIVFTIINNRYQSAIDIAKTITEDLLFHAGCIEGLAAAIYIRQITLGNALDPNFILDITHKYDEAILLYQRSGVRELHVESLLRYAHFNSTCGDYSRRLNAVECVTRAYEYASQLTTQERVSILLFHYHRLYSNQLIDYCIWICSTYLQSDGIQKKVWILLERKCSDAQPIM